MPKFFLIDQSLEGLGGHHFDLAQCLVEAAERAGWESIVGTHQRFNASQTAFEKVRATPVFRNTTYSKHSYLAGMVAMSRKPLGDAAWDSEVDQDRETVATASVTKQLLSTFLTRHLFRRRQTLIRQFAVDCERFFAPHIFEDGDQAFLAGASELELMGLAAYLCNHPRTNQIRWNVLFHFNLFNGLPANYGAQFPTAQLVRRCFVSALARVPYHHISFYTTTAELADQYNRLNVASFEPLSYPVNDRFTQPISKRAKMADRHRPMKLTLAGAIRREKRQCHVAQSIVNELWDDLFATGQIELQIQRPRRFRLLRPKIEIDLPESPALGKNPIHYFEHPLAEKDYVQLIQSTDIGLLAYDSHAYYARRAGILGEYLSAGRPVIVLGGSWLAEQIQESGQRHVTALLKDHPCVQRLTISELTPRPDNVPQAGGVVAFDKKRRPFQGSFPIQRPIDALAIQYRCHYPGQAGAFCRIEFHQFAGDRMLVPPQAVALGMRTNQQLVSAMFRVDRRANRCHVRFSNACDDSTISARDVGILGIDTAERAIPRSAVGVIAADVAGLPEAIREVVAHYAHYRETAESFATAYRDQHRPDTTFAELVNRPVVRAKSA